MTQRAQAVSAQAANLRAENLRRYRHKIRNLAYVDLDANRGILRDISEFGVASHTLVAMQIDQHVDLSLDLRDPRTHVEARGRVAWTDGSGQSGIEFVDLPQGSGVRFRNGSSLSCWLRPIAPWAMRMLRCFFRVRSGRRFDSNHKSSRKRVRSGWPA
jgi:PilZ domain